MTGIRSSSDARTSWVATSGFHASPEQCIYRQTDRQIMQMRIDNLLEKNTYIIQKASKVTQEKNKTYSVAMVADFDDEVILAKIPH